MTTEPYVPNEAEIINSHGDGYVTGISADEARRGIAKVKADALREAADDLEDREHYYNDALSAAFVPGEVGRSDVIHAYEAILEEPYGWLRERAARIEEEA